MLTEGGSARATQAGEQADLPALLGGRPIRSQPWPTYDKGDTWIGEEDEQAAIAAIRSQLYFRYDVRPLPETRAGRFEQHLCDYFGVRHALACTSGTTAIMLALLGLNLPAGSPVACPAFTFAATPSAILLAGHRPELVECDGDLHMDVTDLRRALGAGAKAVVVVHMRGFASDMAAICTVAAEFDVPVIEDAVPALGVTLGGRPLGTFGRAGAFSTQSDKSLNTGEGGFLLTNDTELFATAAVLSGAYEGRLARHFPDDRPPIDDLSYPIMGVRMDEIRAALADSLLDRLAARLAAHRRNYDYVSSGLARIPVLALRRPVAPGAYLGEAMVFRVPGATDRQSAWLAAALRAEGIDARALADPDDHNVRAFWNWRFLVGQDPDKAKARWPATAGYLAETIDVPLSANLTLNDCDQLIAAVARALPAVPPA